MADQDKRFQGAFLKQNRLQVSDLYNSLEFGFESVTIIQEDDGYRLVIRNFGNELYNKSFAGIMEARQAFLKLYDCFPGVRARKIIPQWTDFFDPDFHLDEITLYMINQALIFQSEN